MEQIQTTSQWWSWEEKWEHRENSREKLKKIRTAYKDIITKISLINRKSWKLSQGVFRKMRNAVILTMYTQRWACISSWDLEDTNRNRLALNAAPMFPYTCCSEPYWYRPAQRQQKTNLTHWCLNYPSPRRFLIVAPINFMRAVHGHLQQ